MTEEKIRKGFDEKLCKKFDYKLKEIFEFLQRAANGISNTKHIKEFKASLLKAMRTSTIFGMTIIGPFIKTNETKVKNKDEKYFMNVDYSKSLTELSTTYDFPYKDAAETIEIMKKTFDKLIKTQKEEFINLILALLTIYDEQHK